MGHDIVLLKPQKSHTKVALAALCFLFREEPQRALFTLEITALYRDNPLWVHHKP